MHAGRLSLVLGSLLVLLPTSAALAKPQAPQAVDCQLYTGAPALDSTGAKVDFGSFVLCSGAGIQEIHVWVSGWAVGVSARQAANNKSCYSPALSCTIHAYKNPKNCNLQYYTKSGGYFYVAGQPGIPFLFTPPSDRVPSSGGIDVC